MDSKRINRTMTIFVFLITALFLGIIRYTNPLIGDDVSGFTINREENIYQDDYVQQGECEIKLYTNPLELFNRMTQFYQRWGGRVTSFLGKWFVCLIFSLPDNVIWIVYTLYITVLLMVLYWLVMGTVHNRGGAVFEFPLIACLIAVLLFYVPKFSYGYMTRIVMYTMANIYVLSCIFYLIYNRMLRSSFRKEGQTNTANLILINVIGALAGLSHELYGAIWGLVFLIQLGRYWYRQKGVLWKCLLCYPGYFVGYCICFFAPGNFNRAGQGHESQLRTSSIAQRMLGSLVVHSYIAYNLLLVSGIILLISLVVLFYVYKKKAFPILFRIVCNNIEWFLAFGLSIIGWGIVTRPVTYGMLLPNIVLMIGTYRCILDVREQVKAKGEGVGRLAYIGRCSWIISFLVIAVLFLSQFETMKTALHISNEWKQQIMYAREHNSETAEVTEYPDTLDQRFYDIANINAQTAYDKDFYRVVYGTHVQITKEESAE